MLIYLCRPSDVLGIDLEQAAANKIAANAERYSIEVSHGNAEKVHRNSALASGLHPNCRPSAAAARTQGAERPPSSPQTAEPGTRGFGYAPEEIRTLTF